MSDLPDPDTLAPGLLRLVPGSLAPRTEGDFLQAMVDDARAAAFREASAAQRTPRGDMEALVRSFPTLSAAPARFFGPFEPLWGGTPEGRIGFRNNGRGEHGSILFARWCAETGGGGQRDAGLFVLSVWGGAGEDWNQWLSRGDGPTGGKFCLHRALGNWDAKHRAAFVAWASDPWWL